jgi:hypothetical protein
LPFTPSTTPRTPSSGPLFLSSDMEFLLVGLAHPAEFS